MTTPARRSTLFALTAAFCMTMMPAHGHAASPETGAQIVSRIFVRILAMAEAPADRPWPPRFMILDDPVPNAYATWMPRANDPDDLEAVVIVTTSLFDIVTPDKEDYYAYVIGHEIAHHALSHVGRDRRGPKVLESANSRVYEFDADSLGMRYAVQAGYSLSRARNGIMTLVNAGAEHPRYWAGGVSHPSFRDRLARLDAANRTLWRSIGAFENGVFFLGQEQFLAAEKCFRSVIAEFPDAEEAWTNLGYALLMRYCDGLSADDVRRLDIGHIVTGAFHGRAMSLENNVRGVDEDVWWDAVNALTEGLRLSPSSIITRATLGLAYLVHPTKKDVASAGKYLLAAAKDAEADADLSPYIRAVVLANAAVLRMGEDPAAALAAIDRVDQLEAETGTQHPGFRLDQGVRASLVFNRAVLLSRDKGVEARKKTAALLENYLSNAPMSAWWKVAYERYVEATRAAGVKPVREEHFRKAQPGRMRYVTTVALDSARNISVSESMAQVLERMPALVEVPLTGRGSLRLYVDERLGMEILSDELVLAIIFDDDRSPAVTVQGDGLGARTGSLRIGMEKEEIDSLLAKHDFTFRELFSRDHLYRMYNTLGLALRIRDGALAQIVLLSPQD